MLKEQHFSQIGLAKLYKKERKKLLCLYFCMLPLLFCKIQLLLKVTYKNVVFVIFACLVTDKHSHIVVDSQSDYIPIIDNRT